MTNPMTPTEQDKELLNASDELRVDLVTAPEEMCEHGVNLRLCQCHRCDGTAIYTEADRKRVELEARLDELERLQAADMNLYKNVVIAHRIAELKAQQEEV